MTGKKYNIYRLTSVPIYSFCRGSDTLQVLVIDPFQSLSIHCNVRSGGRPFYIYIRFCYALTITIIHCVTANGKDGKSYI